MFVVSFALKKNDPADATSWWSNSDMRHVESSHPPCDLPGRGD